jgi:hypothetical protein
MSHLSSNKDTFRASEDDTFAALKKHTYPDLEAEWFSWLTSERTFYDLIAFLKERGWTHHEYMNEKLKRMTFK